jgi:hypothetical protein
VTSADFKAEGIDMGRWVRARWLLRTDQREGRLYKHVRGDKPAPDVGYETEKAQLKRGAA